MDVEWELYSGHLQSPSPLETLRQDSLLAESPTELAAQVVQWGSVDWAARLFRQPLSTANNQPSLPPKVVSLIPPFLPEQSGEIGAVVGGWLRDGVGLEFIKQRLNLLNNPGNYQRSAVSLPIADLPPSASVLGPAIEDLLLRCCVDRIQFLHAKHQEFIQQRPVGSPALSLQESYEAFWHPWSKFADQFYALVSLRYISIHKFLIVLRGLQVSKSNSILFLISQALSIEDNHVRALFLADGVNETLDLDVKRKAFEVSSDMEAGLSAYLDVLTEESTPEHGKFTLRDLSFHTNFKVRSGEMKQRAQKALTDFINKHKAVELIDFATATPEELQAACLRSNLNSQTLSDLVSRYLGLVTSQEAQSASSVPASTASNTPRISKTQVLPVYFLGCLSVRSRQLLIENIERELLYTPATSPVPLQPAVLEVYARLVSLTLHSANVTTGSLQVMPPPSNLAANPRASFYAVPTPGGSVQDSFVRFLTALKSRPLPWRSHAILQLLSFRLFRPLVGSLSPSRVFLELAPLLVTASVGTPATAASATIPGQSPQSPQNLSSSSSSIGPGHHTTESESHLHFDFLQSFLLSISFQLSDVVFQVPMTLDLGEVLNRNFAFFCARACQFWGGVLDATQASRLRKVFQNFHAKSRRVWSANTLAFLSPALQQTFPTDKRDPFPIAVELIRQEIQFLGQIERFVTQELQLRFLVLCYARLSTASASRGAPSTPGGPTHSFPLPLEPTFVSEVVRRMAPATLSKATYLLIEYVVLENPTMEVNVEVISKLIWQYDAMRFEVVLAALAEYIQHAKAAHLLEYLLVTDIETTKRIGTWSQFTKAEWWIQPDSTASEAYHLKFKIRGSWLSSGLVPSLSSDIALSVPMIDLLISRCIEEGNGYLLNSIIGRFGPLYRSHPMPLTFVLNTLKYYYSSLLIYDNTSVRLMIAEGILDFAHEGGFFSKIPYALGFCDWLRQRDLTTVDDGQTLFFLESFLSQLYVTSGIGSSPGGDISTWSSFEELGGPGTTAFTVACCGLLLMLAGPSLLSKYEPSLFQYPTQLAQLFAHLPPVFDHAALSWFNQHLASDWKASFAFLSSFVWHLTAVDRTRSLLLKLLKEMQFRSFGELFQLADLVIRTLPRFLGLDRSVHIELLQALLESISRLYNSSNATLIAQELYSVGPLATGNSSDPLAYFEEIIQLIHRCKALFNLTVGAVEYLRTIIATFEYDLQEYFHGF